MKPLTPEVIARIREEWQEEIRNEKPKRINNGGRAPQWVDTQLNDLIGLSIGEQAEKLKCSRRTVEKLRHTHPYYVEQRRKAR